MKIRPVGAELFYADGRTDRQADMMKLRVAFHNFAKASKTRSIAASDPQVTLRFVDPTQPAGQYMYRTAIIICNAQWSLYVPHIGHYM